MTIKRFLRRNQTMEQRQWTCVPVDFIGATIEKHINKHQKGKEKESIEHSAADGKVHGVFRETKNSRYIVYMSYFFVAILYIFS